MSSEYKGLSSQEVEISRLENGDNLLTPPKREPMWKLFIKKFNDPIIRILIIAAALSLVISFVHNEFAETIGIVCAIFLATFVGFWFEMDANKKFEILNQVNDDTLIKVVRDNEIQEVAKKDVVVGDVILLDTGDEVPADGELLEAISLQMNESCLTGEPMIHKTTNPKMFNTKVTYPSNMVMRGTTVIDGHGVMRVTAVGDSTEFGKVAQLSAVKVEEETPLNKQLDGLAKLIGFAGFSLAIFTFGALFIKDLSNYPDTPTQLALLLGSIGALMIASIKIWLPLILDGFELFRSKAITPKFIYDRSGFTWLGIGIAFFFVVSGLCYIFGTNPLERDSWIPLDKAEDILQYFMISVTLIVVAVPEGLPMSVTLSLALSMRRMLKTNNLVRKMHACETMGATTVICTDKTGTLTQNQMQVHQTNFYSLSSDQSVGDNNLIIESIAINSTAHLNKSSDKITTIGNPTEAAMLLWLDKQQTDYKHVRDNAQILEQLTFSTERKYMATLVKSGDKNLLLVKGAPEVIMSKSIDILTKEGKSPIKLHETEILDELLNYQNKAMRTLGFAYKEVDSSVTTLPDISGLTLIGVVAISDPIRKDVPAAVKECLDAGIDVKIVTGDTTGTAKEIGRQIGIWNDNDTEQNIITGVDFEALSEAEAEKRVLDLKIMCRARPSDKQRLVRLLQRNEEIVAVTGDGTNDAPALNFANVGLSMGSGTSVAKEASDITLIDDSFKSIATAVMWGRSLYQNIQRFILFQLTINVTALLIVFIGTFLGKELPLTVTQMLWVNLIMDTFAAAALASLPPDNRVMSKRPRKNSDFIINPAMRNNILATSTLFVVSLLALLYIFTNSEGDISNYDLSIFFTTFVFLQLWNMFNAKAFATGRSAFYKMKESLGFIAVLLIIVIGQFLIVTFGGEVFRTEPLSLKDWLIIIASTSSIFWIGEIVRLVKRKS